MFSKLSGGMQGRQFTNRSYGTKKYLIIFFYQQDVPMEHRRYSTILKLVRKDRILVIY